MRIVVASSRNGLMDTLGKQKEHNNCFCPNLFISAVASNSDRMIERELAYWSDGIDGMRVFYFMLQRQ